MSTQNPDLPEPPDDLPNPDDDPLDSEYPELDALASILERTRILAGKYKTDIQINFHVHLKSVSGDKIKEKYIYSTALVDKKLDHKSEEYKKLTEELKQIVTEEVKLSFPDSDQDPSKKELDTIIGIHENLLDPEPDNIRNNNQVNDSSSPFMQLRRFEDLK